MYNIHFLERWTSGRLVFYLNNLLNRFHVIVNIIGGLSCFLIIVTQVWKLVSCNAVCSNWSSLLVIITSMNCSRKSNSCSIANFSDGWKLLKDINILWISRFWLYMGNVAFIYFLCNTYLLIVVSRVLVFMLAMKKSAISGHSGEVISVLFTFLYISLLKLKCTFRVCLNISFFKYDVGITISIQFVSM